MIIRSLVFAILMALAYMTQSNEKDVAIGVEEGFLCAIDELRIMIDAKELTSSDDALTLLQYMDKYLFNQLIKECQGIALDYYTEYK